MPNLNMKRKPYECLIAHTPTLCSHTFNASTFLKQTRCLHIIKLWSRTVQPHLQNVSYEGCKSNFLRQYFMYNCKTANYNRQQVVMRMFKCNKCTHVDCMNCDL